MEQTTEQRGNLILTRKMGESIDIYAGDQVIKVTLVRWYHGGVAVGIEADRSIKVLRSELAGNRKPVER